MKNYNLSGIFVFLAFTILGLFSVCYPSAFISAGSKLIWSIDRNAASNKGIYFYDNDYVITPSARTSTDYEFNQLMALKQKLDTEGINLLYVNKPTKYLDDSIFTRFGTLSYSNANADRLLQRLQEAGVSTLDLREEIKHKNLDIYKMFYRTDHHWTVPSGKWGAAKIAAKLNKEFGYHIDTKLYDDENYDFKTTSESWLGEQGAQFNGSAIKKDDYTLVTPKFNTKYSIDENDETIYDFTKLFISDVNACYHYNYSACDCINMNVNNGNIMFFGDSYDMITEPFLSLGVHNISFGIMRNIPETDIYENYIKDRGYDTVIVCYAPFMIGAHDGRNSANYNMFNFDPEIK